MSGPATQQPTDPTAGQAPRPPAVSPGNHNDDGYFTFDRAGLRGVIRRRSLREAIFQFERDLLDRHQADPRGRTSNDIEQIIYGHYSSIVSEEVFNVHEVFFNLRSTQIVPVYTEWVLTGGARATWTSDDAMRAHLGMQTNNEDEEASASEINFRIPPTPVPEPKIQSYDEVVATSKAFNEKYKEDNMGAMAVYYYANARFNEAQMLDYIKELALNSRTDISNWDLVEIFVDKATMSIPDNRREVNKKFFATRIPSEIIGGERAIKIDEIKPFDVKEVFQGDLMNIAAALAPQLKTLEADYKLALNTMNTKRDAYMKIYAAHRGLMRTDNADENALVKQLREIEATGLFSVEKYAPTENTFIFKNRRPFIIQLNKEYQRSGITEIYLGHFDIKVNFLTFNAFCSPTADNHKKVLYTANHGPFLGAHGKVCFGHEQIRVDKFLKTKDILGLMKLLWEVMCSFEDGVNPHTHLDHFIATQEYLLPLTKDRIIEDFEKNGEITSKERKKKLGHIHRTAQTKNDCRIYWDFYGKEFVRLDHHHRKVPCCERTAAECGCSKG